VKHAVSACAAVLAFVRLIPSSAHARITVAVRIGGRPLDYLALGARRDRKLDVMRAVLGLR
jgi:hypothetical protein